MCVPDTYFVLSTSSHRKKRAYLILLNGIKSCKEVNVAHGSTPSLQQKLFSQGRDTFSGVTTTSTQGQLFRNKSTDTKSAGIKEKWLPTYFTWISFIFSKSLRETNLVQKCTKMCCNKMCGTIFCVALKFDKGLKGL